MSYFLISYVRKTFYMCHLFDRTTPSTEQPVPYCCRLSGRWLSREFVCNAWYSVCVSRHTSVCPYLSQGSNHAAFLTLFVCI
jgi:hypothetical protein